MTEGLIVPAGHRKINPFFIIKNDALKFIDFTIKVFAARERREVRTPEKNMTRLIRAGMKENHHIFIRL